MILNFLINLITGKGKDRRKAECPYCQGVLKKIPGAKTKCPHCSEYMYIRTRTNGVRVVATHSEAKHIDKQWRIKNGTQEAYLAEQNRIEKMRKALRIKFGEEPSEHDVQWGILNEDILITAKNYQWGLYRNTRSQMAEILYLEKNLKAALGMYLGVCYLDLNGPRNVFMDENGNAITDIEFFNPFDPNLKFLAPGVINRIQRVIKMGDFDKDIVKKLFFDIATKEQIATHAPVSPVDCFTELEAEIW